MNLFGAIELCHAVLPAMCRSGFRQIANESSVSRHLSRDLISKQALRPLPLVRCGKPAEVADAVLFFTSPAASCE